MNGKYSNRDFFELEAELDEARKTGNMKVEEAQKILESISKARQYPGDIKAHLRDIENTVKPYAPQWTVYAYATPLHDSFPVGHEVYMETASSETDAVEKVKRYRKDASYFSEAGREMWQYYYEKVN